jgi:fibronectin-binding autotransporter adhesin
LVSTHYGEYVGYSGTGIFTQSGGSNWIFYFGTFTLGVKPGSSGTYNLIGNGQLIGPENEYVGGSGTGTFTQSAGTNNISNANLILGANPGSSGTYNLRGSGQVSADIEYIGYASTGVFTQTGGTNITGALVLGANSNGGVYATVYNGSGAYNLSGGQLSSAAYGEYVGYCGTGTFTQSGGTNAAGALCLGYTSGSSGIYNLNGGLLNVSALSVGTGTAAFNFNGGILQASSSFSTNLPMTLDATGGGATFDTAGYTVTLSGSMSGPGSLTLDDSLGNGTLILTASNTYTGGTYVDAGTLIITNNTALPDGTNLTVGTNATLIFDFAAAGSPITNSAAAAAVPEPSTLVLVGVGAIGLIGYRWRRLRRAEGTIS